LNGDQHEERLPDGYAQRALELAKPAAADLFLRPLQGSSVALRSQACAFFALLPKINRPPI
jgi:hypothetical protein